MKYRIFDSMDRPCSHIADRESDLIPQLNQLREEEEEVQNNLTFAIGKILPGGEVTYDY